VPPAGFRAALGFRAHSGWAVLVAVSGRPGSSPAPAILLRERIEMADPKIAGSVQPYHHVREQPLAQARKFLERCTTAGRQLAVHAVQAALDVVQRQGYQVAACGLLLSSARPLPELKSVLASHPLLHTAEGELFRELLAYAGSQCGLAVTRTKERELFEHSTARFGLTQTEIRRMLAELGRDLPPPWRQDEKFAALAGWLALAEKA
jgi:hypothetical protein